MKYSVNTKSISFLGDMLTPITVYSALRERFSKVFLLESSDYHGKEDSQSIICFDSLASIEVKDSKINYSYENELYNDSVNNNIVEKMDSFINSFDINGETHSQNGVYGYSSFDAIQYFDTVKLHSDETEIIPDMCYHFFRYILVINPFNNKVQLIENIPTDSSETLEQIKNSLFATFPPRQKFSCTQEEVQNMSDEDFCNMVTKGKEHCQRGDVFQIVLSRRFSQKFEGDDFYLYRSLRSVNPSPYLFYFDFGNFRLIGSSPEAEIIVSKNRAQIHPIAGTYRRTGDDEQDRVKAIELSNDPKEVAEHIMLVDLARNDISRNCENVEVATFKEIQYFSHVIHLVSNVTGDLSKGSSGVQVFTDTFPAGTLSGAPKFKAIEMIDKYEPHKRGFYGGAIGYIGFDGSVNHAIMIRSFLSKDKTLQYQAGAGVTISSVEESERQEVTNKLAALKTAIAKAEEL
jgi:anthranilate synthase component 1